MIEPTPSDRQTNPPLGHEPGNVSLRAILTCAAALVVLAVIVHVGAWLLFAYLAARERRAKPDLFPLAAEERQQRPPPDVPTPRDWNAPREPPPLPAKPQLEGIVRLEGKEPAERPGMRRSEALDQLDRYQWVDREKGIVRIPLEQAMSLIVERGMLPSHPAKAGTEREGSQRLPSRANSGRSPNERVP
jgi:hypothetical protein